MKKLVVTLCVLMTAVNVFAMGSDQDYFYAMYGQNAKKHFDQLPKLTNSCAYIQNDTDANGNTVDSIKLVIQGNQINSIICRSLGEVTYACEASTMWVSDPCKN